jgi:hypothetical protein
VTSSEKPRLLVDYVNPDLTVARLRDILATSNVLYDRGVPVRIAFDQRQGRMVAQPMTPDVLVLVAHEICRPYSLKTMPDGTVCEIDARLPRSIAVMYLDWIGEWRLRPLNGIATSPLLQDDGTIRCAQGYDSASGLWCEHVPDLGKLVPERPTKEQAARALQLIRNTFKTFCFADADTVDDATTGLAVVDTTRSPGRDESAFLVALSTALCRPSLHLAPGVVLQAASISGSGAGKGLLARCISNIAFGREPEAVTAGGSTDELDKRIAAELIQGSPVLFLDNLNNRSLKSELLASAITERPARVRLLGKSQMVLLNPTAFVIVTGNGLSIMEDLARRLLSMEFDARMEDPESREFAIDIRAEVKARRTELMVALLTIWRWGRIAQDIKPGLPLGSFEQWGRWVRDPLVALGCQDPVARVREAKRRDAHRHQITELFTTWWQKHRDQPVPASQLHDDVKHILDPQRRGRQFLVAQVEKLAGTRMAGFVLTRQASPGRWGVATYALERTSEGHRERGEHRAHRPEGDGFEYGDTPYAPDADGAHGGNGESRWRGRL